MSAPGPTLAGFQSFIQNVMNVQPQYLPPSSPVIGFALAVALNIVNPQLQWLPTYCGPPISGVPAVSMYTLAVYNLAADNLVNFAQDQPGCDYFNDLRNKFNTYGFVSGVIQSGGDEGTNESMVIMDAAKQFTMANLQQLKTPWGRQYMAFAQSYGPTTWGIS